MVVFLGVILDISYDLFSGKHLSNRYYLLLSDDAVSLFALLFFCDALCSCVKYLDCPSNFLRRVSCTFNFSELLLNCAEKMVYKSCKF